MVCNRIAIVFFAFSPKKMPRFRRKPALFRTKNICSILGLRIGSKSRQTPRFGGWKVPDFVVMETNAGQATAPEEEVLWPPFTGEAFLQILNGMALPVGAGPRPAQTPPTRGPEAGTGQKAPEELLRRLRLSKKAEPFSTMRMQPAARNILSAKGGQNSHLQAEKCFPRRTCRREKQFRFHSRLRPRTLRGLFDTLKRRRNSSGASFCIDYSASTS